VTPTEKITPADLEAKMRELQGEVDETTETAKSYALAAAAAAGVVLFVIAFTMGKRRGKKKSTVVEIRRI
jgi:G:T/U-mismatch repair DNA glycosylase